MKVFVLLFLTFAIQAFAQDCPDTLWSRIWRQAPGVNVGYDVVESPNGGFLVGGYKGFWPTNDVWIARTDSNGDTLWTRTYGLPGVNEGCLSVDLCHDSNYLLTGWRAWGDNSDPSDSAVVYVLKVNDNGDTLWTHTFGRQGLMVGWEGQEVSSGGYIITGATNYFEQMYSQHSPDADSSDMFLLRLDENGDSLWFHTYEGALGDEAYKVLETADGGFVITGPSRSFTDTNFSDVVLLKTDSEGNQEWLRTYGHPGVADVGWAIAITLDNGFLIGGQAYTVPGSQAYIIRTDSQGNLIWDRMYRRSFSDVAYNILTLPDGDFVTAISSLYAIAHEDIYLLRGSPNGDSLRSCTYLLPRTEEEIATAILRRTNGSYFITGFTGENTNGAFLLLTEPDLLTANEERDLLPTLYSLSAYPNPFNSSTEIRYELAKQERVKLSVYDILGREVRELVNEVLSAGEHRVVFEGKGLGSGIYFARMETEGFSHIRKMVLLK